MSVSRVDKCVKHLNRLLIRLVEERAVCDCFAFRRVLVDRGCLSVVHELVACDGGKVDRVRACVTCWLKATEDLRVYVHSFSSQT